MTMDRVPANIYTTILGTAGNLIDSVPAPRAPRTPMHEQAFRMKEVLRVLADSQPRSTVEIAEHCGMSLDSSNKVIKRLETKGLVERAGTIPHTKIALWRKV